MRQAPNMSPWLFKPLNWSPHVKLSKCLPDFAIPIICYLTSGFSQNLNYIFLTGNKNLSLLPLNLKVSPGLHLWISPFLYYTQSLADLIQIHGFKHLWGGFMNSSRTFPKLQTYTHTYIYIRHPNKDVESPCKYMCVSVCIYKFNSSSPFGCLTDPSKLV